MKKKVQYASKLAIDTETTGLSWKATPYMLSVFDGERSFVYDLRNSMMCKQARKHLLQADTLIGANTWFDLRMLCCKGVLTVTEIERYKVRDVLQDNYIHTGVWTEGGLKAVAFNVLKIKPDERDLQFEAMRKLHPRCNRVFALTRGYEAWAETALYCQQDARMAWRLAEVLPEADTSADRLTLLQTLKGIRIDLPFANLCVKVLREIGREVTEKHGILSTSPTKLAQAMGTRNADKEVLKKQALTKDNGELASDVMTYRDTSKMADMFDGIVRQTDDSGRVHPLLQWKCRTGRASCKAPNLQQLHKKPRKGIMLRNVILSDHPQEVLVSADYSGIELVLFAYVAKCKNIIKWLNDGEDSHSHLTEMVFGGNNAFESVRRASAGKHTDEEILRALKVHNNSVVRTEKALECSRSRDLNKRLMFATIYGAQAQKIATTVDIPLAQARALLRRLNRVLPEMKKAQDEYRIDVSKQGWVATLTGRRIGVDSPHKALNSVIQSTAADIMRGALVSVENYLVDNAYGRTLFTVHDEVVCSVSPAWEKVETIAEGICNVMTETATRLCKVEIKADYTIHGERWGVK